MGNVPLIFEVSWLCSREWQCIAWALSLHSSAYRCPTAFALSKYCLLHFLPSLHPLLSTLQHPALSDGAIHLLAAAAMAQS